MRCWTGRRKALAAGSVLLVAAALVGLGAGLAVMVLETTTQEQERLVIVDSDGGPDDALAIMLLLAAENQSFVPTHIRVLAVTCVRGNTGVHNVTRNILATLHATNRLDVKVYAGAVQALVPPAPNFSYYYGYDGFGDFLPPSEPVAPVQPEHAAVALVRLAKENPGALTLICIGPLTNIALALRLDPSFFGNLKEIFILGGAAHGNGNTRPGAEFNMFMDAEAAAVVFEDGNKTFSILPWETALQSETPIEWRLDALGSLNTPAIQLLNLAERKVLNYSTWVSADALLAANVIDAEIIASRSHNSLSVLTGAGRARGVTVVDYSDTLGNAPNAIILEEASVSLFQRLVLRLMS